MANSGFGEICETSMPCNSAMLAACAFKYLSSRTSPLQGKVDLTRFHGELELTSSSSAWGGEKTEAVTSPARGQNPEEYPSQLT